MPGSEVNVHPEKRFITQDNAVARGLFESEEDMAAATGRLASWIDGEVMRAKMGRHEQENLWIEALQLYEGRTEREHRNTPIEKAPNIQVTLGAIAADAVYAQMLNIIFNISPLVTVSPVDETGEFTEHAKALQRLVNIVARNEMKLRPAAENAILDNVKLGTGVYYVLWRERRKKTQTNTVTMFGPRARAIPVEDFFLPAGATDDLQDARWVAWRVWLTAHELNLRARDLKWNVSGTLPSTQTSNVRQTRERLGRTQGDASRQAGDENEGGDLFEVFEVYCLFDIDGDGIDEDLLVTWDAGSRNVLRWTFNPYDSRPFEVMRYQLREYLFYGMGIVEMLRPFQKGATELYNHWVLNSMLANARFWTGKHGAVPHNQLRIWPNRYLPLQNPREDLIPHQMADTYPSASASLATTMSFAERRSGVNDLTTPRPSQVLGSRTPGITALSMLQKANERFGPAFDAARMATTGAVRQGILRYHERILAGDEKVVDHIMDLLGEERGALAIELMQRKDFNNAVDIELSGSNAQQNRETARQNMILFMQNLLPYFERILQLQAVVSNPQTPPAVRELAGRVSDAAAEVVERVARTFDEVRDPSQLVVRIDNELDQAQNLQVQGLQGLGALLQQMDQTEQQGGGPGGILG